ncbi:threonine/serine exporter family protein [Thalassiella azotivora]
MARTTPDRPDPRPGTAGPRPPHRALRSAAARVVRSSAPPTQPISLHGGADGVPDATARAVVDLALRLGEALLSTGASASDVTATVLRLVDAYGLRSVHVDVTFTSVTVSVHRGDDDDPMTLMRVVRVRSQDYTRLQHLYDVVRDASTGDLAVEEARARLDDAVRSPHPYRRWLVTASLAAMGASIAALFGGGVRLLLLTAVTTAVVDRAQRRLTRSGLPAFFTQAVGAAIPASVAVGMFLLIANTDLDVADLPPSLVVATGIIVLLAGLSVLGAAQDAVDGYYLTAGARGLEVLMLTLGIVVGVAAVLAVAGQLGVPLTISTETGLNPNPVATLVAAVLVSWTFALSAYAQPRAALVGAVMGGVGWVANGLASALGAGPATSAAFAAALIGLMAQVVAERWRMPALALTTAAIVPLLPGMRVYRGLFTMIEQGEGGMVPGLTILLGAAGIGMGLAAGVSLGAFIGRPLRSELDRWQRRALRRSTAGARD